MDVLEGIYSRHSIGKVRPEGVDRATIEKLLDAAVQAPNHHLTEPWRFFVLSGKAREELGEIMARVLRREKPDASEEELEREKAKPLRAPVLIAVTSDAGKDPVETAENRAAAAAAVQNILLAAHALGLAAQWRTGPAAYSPEAKEWLGVPEDTAILSFVYLGHPDMEPKARRRHPAEEKTEWRGAAPR